MFFLFIIIINLEKKKENKTFVPIHFLSFQSTVSAPSPVKKQPHEDDFKARTKQVLERLFPNIPSNTDDDVTYDIWLTNVTKHIEQQILQQQQREASQNKQIKQSIDNKNHQNGNNHLSDNGAALNNSTEELLLQNAKLKATVDEYKTIISETVIFFSYHLKIANKSNLYLFYFVIYCFRKVF